MDVIRNENVSEFEDDYAVVWVREESFKVDAVVLIAHLPDEALLRAIDGDIFNGFDDPFHILFAET